jgi:hypothetical protein
MSLEVCGKPYHQGSIPLTMRPMGWEGKILAQQKEPRIVIRILQNHSGVLQRNFAEAAKALIPRSIKISI